MSKLIFIIFLMPLISQAQNSLVKTDSVASLVRQYFNEKNSDKIYSLAGAEFKKALTQEKFKDVCNNNLFPLGAMPKPIFISSTNGLSKYKVEFDAVTLGMYLSLDSLDKLQGFLFKEYIDDTKKTGKIPTNNSLTSPLDKEVDAAIQPYINLAAATGLSIAVLKGDKMFFYGYGETAKGNKQLPDEKTIFEIGSITKTFTATLLADAVNHQKIKLNDPVNKYLPANIPKLQFEGVPVTIQMLSNHSSSIPRMPSNFDDMTNPRNPYINYTVSQLFDFYKTLKLERKPGTVYEYSNLAVATLGVILEKLYKKSFEQLVIEKITGPLKMNDTRQFLRKTDSSRFAKGYNASGVYNGQWDFKAFAPAGAIRSTAADMLLYAKANMGGATGDLNKDIQLTHVVTFTDEKNKTALGWHYIRPGKDEVLFHNGGTGGFTSYLAINMDKKFAVVILSNTAIGTEEPGNMLMKWLESH